MDVYIQRLKRKRDKRFDVRKEGKDRYMKK